MTRSPPNTTRIDTFQPTTPVTHVAMDSALGDPSHTLGKRSQESIDFQGVIANAIEIEHLASQTFRLLQRDFLDDHPRASHVFAKLADDEADHAATLTRQSDLVRTRPEAFTPINALLGRSQHILIRRLREGVKRIETTALSLDCALQLGLEIEEGDDRMIADFRGCLGTFAFGTRVIEVLAMHKHPDHNVGLVTMAHKRGVGKLPKRERMDAVTTTSCHRGNQ